MKNKMTASSTDCTILYTTTNGEKINLNEETFNRKIIAHSYCKEGIIKFEKPITKIPAYAFSNCTTLLTITIPECIKTFYTSSFYGCTSIKEYNHSYASDDKRCIIVNGVLKLFASGNISEYEVPNNIVKIGNGVFRKSNLTKVIIPESVHIIDDCAFEFCWNLSEVIIYNGVLEIGKSAFANCPKLKSITIPSTITKVGDWAFDGCKSLRMFNSDLATSDKRCLILNGNLVAFATAEIKDYTFPPEIISYQKTVFGNTTKLEKLKKSLEYRKSKTILELKSIASKEVQSCQWVKNGENIQIKELTLSRGNFYVGNYFKVKKDKLDKIKYPQRNRKIYSAVINPNLPISEENVVGSKNEFSSYYDLTEYERYLYLSWLASITPTKDIPDELLDFHIWGIQVRLFLDAETTKSEREHLINVLQSIRSEVSSKSKIIWHINSIIDAAITIYFINEPNKIALSEIHLSMYERILISQNSEIDAKRAFEIFTSVYPNYFPMQFLSYIYNYFSRNFKLRHLRHCKSAYIENVQIPIRFISPYFMPESLDYWYSYSYVPIACNQRNIIPDFFNKLIEVFKNYEKITNDATSLLSPLAYFSLPKCIIGKDVPFDLQSKLENLVDKQEVVLSYNTLLELWGIKSSVKILSISHIDSIITGLGKLGYGIIPNYLINNKRITSKTGCVIYKQAKRPAINIDSEFHEMELLAKLIVLVIQVDGFVNSDLTLIRTILSEMNDNVSNLSYLNGYILFMLQNKQPFDNTIREEMKSLKTSKKQLFLHVLLRLTIINGDVNYKRVESLKRILPYLNKKNISIHVLIHQMITNYIGHQNVSFYQIPNIKSEVNIDSKKLNEYLKMTHESQLMLSDIFSESFSEEDMNFSDNNHVVKEMLSLLFTKEQWKKDELEMICKKKGLMLGSILEEINDYSYSVVDDAVLEDEGDVVNVINDYKKDLLC